MGKISLVASKYLINATIEIEGTVDRPDVIGAIFGQTEGLLGEDLELRELQRNGKIGRIEVNLKTKAGKSSGEIIIPSSVDKAETAIIAAALETIQRIGPCNSKVNVKEIEDVRISKRDQVLSRAKELLKDLTDSVLPDSQEITDNVANSVRVMEAIEYGKERLTAGPFIEESEEIIIVEGRADVLNLLKHGFKNAIALNGTSVPQSIIELCKEKTVVVFVDGDRGGDLIIKELMDVAEIDFITKAPDGKEVEEITKKEINKAIRSKITFEQAKKDLLKNSTQRKITKENTKTNSIVRERQPKKYESRTMQPRTYQRKQQTKNYSREIKLPSEDLEIYTKMIKELKGSKNAYILDEEKNILGEVPSSELTTTIKSMRTGIFAIVFDGTTDKELAFISERAKIKHLVCNKSEVTGYSRVKIITKENL